MLKNFSLSEWLILFSWTMFYWAVPGPLLWLDKQKAGAVLAYLIPTAFIAFCFYIDQ